MRSFRTQHLAVIAVALLLAGEVVRLTVAATYVSTRLQLAKAMAPEQARTLIAEAMGELGAAAARQQLPSPATRGKFAEALRREPLAPEPFLVAGAIAQQQDRLRDAEKLLLEARRRDPRSSAARLLLAELLFSEGRVAPALSETGVLSKLLPGASAALVPPLAEYVQRVGASPPVVKVLRGDPSLRQALFSVLARDPDNADLLLKLDQQTAVAPETEPSQWKRVILQDLVKKDEYERAYTLWKQFTGNSGSKSLVFNGSFQPLDALPPFNWTFASSGSGIAEAKGGKLRIVYYGRDDATLASELLVLPPGSYELSGRASGSAPAGSLRWVLRCVGKQNGPLADIDLSGSSPVEVKFAVPPDNCVAQELSLAGYAQDRERAD